MIPNKEYKISCYGEEPFYAIYVKTERGFIILRKDGLDITVRKEFVEVIE
jgi:hypothetical protein